MIGLTKAYFKEVGEVSDLREMFTIFIKVGNMVGMHCLSSQVGITSREQHLFGSLHIIFLTPSLLTGSVHIFLQRISIVFPGQMSTIINQMLFK